MNVYEYVWDSPVCRTDPGGLQAPAMPLPVEPLQPLRIYNPENLQMPPVKSGPLVPGPHGHLPQHNYDNPYTLEPYHGYFQCAHRLFCAPYRQRRQQHEQEIGDLQREVGFARQRGVSNDDIERITGPILDPQGCIGNRNTPIPRASVAIGRLRAAPSLREKCEYLHNTYKRAQMLFAQRSCGQATNCAELGIAIHYLVAELAMRHAYIDADCDSIQWGNRTPGEQRDRHNRHLDIVRATLRNCLGRHARRLGCTLSDIYGEMNRNTLPAGAR